MGDINIDMNKDKNADVVKLNRIFDKYDLVQCVNFDTRITDRSATKIDFVVSNKSDAVRCDKLINYKISDHETIKIDQICDKQMECATEKVLSWKNYSKIDLIDNIRKCDWSRFYSCDINKKVELINKNLTKSVAPLTKQVIINSNLKPKKWFDSELCQMKKEKIAKYKEWFANKCEEKWNNYIATRNKYNKLIKNKKNKYTENEIKNASNNQKKMWEKLKKLMPTKKSNASDVIVFDEKEYDDHEEIANKFNSFFIDSISEINNEIPLVNIPKIDKREKIELQFKFKEVNIDQINEITSKLKKKVNKSELCNSNVWNDSMEYCGHFITNVINESLSQGIFPEAWKRATVTPIPKVKNTKVSNEYRPINSMANDEKIIECVVKNQLLEYVETNNLISLHQSAFRANHSCESVVNFLTNDWKIAMENQQKVTAVFLDLQRAFETVDRVKLLEKLERIGVKDVELKWFESYLCDRKQCTKFKNKFSNELNVEIGLPQGTALSVILFLIYIDDITEIKLNGQIVLFADDTVLFVKDSSIEKSIEKVNNDLEKIQEYMNINKLKINKKKTKWMIFSRDEVNVNQSQKVKMGTDEIERVETIKYLGVIMDEKLNFEEQASVCIKKTASKVNFLYRISKKMPMETKKIVYNTIIKPQFEYCSTIYFTCKKELIEEMQKIQNRALRIILSCEWRTPRNTMLQTVNIMSIMQNIKYNVMVIIYKMINGMLPLYLSSNLIHTRQIHSVNTRQNSNNTLRLPPFRLEQTKRNIFYYGIHTTNYQ